MEETFGLKSQMRQRTPSLDDQDLCLPVVRRKWETCSLKPEAT